MVLECLVPSSKRFFTEPRNRLTEPMFFRKFILIIVAVCVVLLSLSFYGCSILSSDGNPEPQPIPKIVEDHDPSWAGDNSWIAFERKDTADQSGIYLIRPDGSQKHLIITNAFSPAFSPDGKFLIFSRNQQLFRYSVETGEFVQLTAQGSNTSADFSPNGDLLASQSTAHDTTVFQYQTWFMNADGTDKRFVGLGTFPDWSFDGKKLAYSGIGGVWIADTSGLNPRFVAKGVVPAWHPSGMFIVAALYEDTPNGIKGLVRFDTTGANFQFLRNGFSPEWSPDGSKLVFSVLTGNGMFSWTCDSNGNNATQLTF